MTRVAGISPPHMCFGRVGLGSHGRSTKAAAVIFLVAATLWCWVESFHGAFVGAKRSDRGRPATGCRKRPDIGKLNRQPIERAVALAQGPALEAAVATAVEDLATASFDMPPLPETYVSPGLEGQEGLYFSKTSGFVRRFAAESRVVSSWANWYQAPWFLRQGDVMTIYAALYREADEVDYQRHLVDTLDGGVVALDVLTDVASSPAPAPSSDAPLVIVVSGLGGGSQDTYVRNMAASLGSQGFAVASLNMRSCGKSPVKTPRLFSAYRGSTDDVRVVVQYARKVLKAGTGNAETSPIFLVGWSNGGTIVANALAEQTTGTGYGHAGVWSAVNGGAALSQPHDMMRSTQNLEDRLIPQRLIYNGKVTQSLIRQVLPHQELFRRGPVPSWIEDGAPVHVDMDGCISGTTLRDVDEAVTRRVFGYASVDDYYRDASSFKRLRHIKVPFAMLSAADDPMSTGWIPEEEARRNPWLLLAYTTHGGHTGWIDNEQWGRSGWTEAFVSEFLSAIVAQSPTRS